MFVFIATIYALFIAFYLLLHIIIVILKNLSTSYCDVLGAQLHQYYKSILIL